MFMDFGSPNFNSVDLKCKRNDTLNNGCGTSNVNTYGVYDYPLASVYAPIQKFQRVFDKEMALSKGTAFEELDLPFMGESIYKGGCSNG